MLPCGEFAIGWVADFLKNKGVRWHNGVPGVTRCCTENLARPFHWLTAVTDGEERTDDAAHHGMTERIGLDRHHGESMRVTLPAE